MSHRVNRSKKAGLAILVLLLSLGLWQFIHTRKKTQVLRFRPQPGTQLVYNIQYGSNSTSAPKPGQDAIAQGFPQQSNLSFQGQLVLTIQEKIKDAYRIAAELQVKQTSGIPSLGQENLKFGFTMSTLGRIDSIAFPEQDFARASFLIVDTLKRLNQNYPIAGVAAGDPWQEKEEHFGASLDIENRITSLSSTSAIFEKKYAAKGFTVKGLGRYEWNAREGIVVKIDVERRIDQSDLQGLVVQSQLLVQMQLSSQKALTSKTLADFNRTWIQNPLPVEETLGQDEFKRHMQRQADQERVADMSLEQLKEGLESASSSDRRGNMALYLQLKSYFRLFPQSIASFQALLLELDLDDDRFKMLATALTAVGNAEAQQLLRDVIQKTESDRRRQRLIPNLSFMDHPDLPSEQFLKDLAQQDSSATTRQTADLGLGTMAHQLRESDPPRAEGLYEIYAKDLRATTETATIIHNLEVIGNVGLGRQIQDIQPFLSSPEEKIRSTAYESLRFVEGQTSRQLLLQGLTTDSSDFVREHAAEGLSYASNQSDTIDSIDRILRTEKNITIIKNLLRVVAQDAVTQIRSRDILRRFLDSCAHPDLCGFVSGMVASLPADTTAKGGG